MNEQEGESVEADEEELKERKVGDEKVEERYPNL